MISWTDAIARISAKCRTRGDSGEDNLRQRAAKTLVGGANHDFRQLGPNGLIATKGVGGRKLNVTGQELVDFTLGSGALILGHGHPAVSEAIRSAIGTGLNLTATTEIEIFWAELVRRLIPSAARVRFTSSGSEAVVLAARLAQIHTGRSHIMTLEGHHLGWLLPSLLEAVHWPSAPTAHHSLLLTSTPEQLLTAIYAAKPAAIILEPTGGSFGRVPLSQNDLTAIMQEARNNGTVVILDETITGFRVSPGGAQSQLPHRPDLTILGKILGGGLPCGAVCGREDIMNLLDNTPLTPHIPRLSHTGTGNGNALVAAAGVATLQAIKNGSAIKTADRIATRLRDGLNNLFRQQNILWEAYGTSSGVHIFMNPEGRNVHMSSWNVGNEPFSVFRKRNNPLIAALRIALLHHGVDVNAWPGAITSSAHSEADTEHALKAFNNALDDLQETGAPLIGWDKS